MEKLRGTGEGWEGRKHNIFQFCPGREGSITMERGAETDLLDNVSTCPASYGKAPENSEDAIPNPILNGCTRPAWIILSLNILTGKVKKKKSITTMFNFKETNNVKGRKLVKRYSQK